MFYTSIDQASLLTQLQDMTAYNLWAITRLTEWLKSKPAALLEATAASSFPGIKATLLHIWEVEKEWLGHLKQNTGSLFHQPQEESLERVLDNLVSHAAEFNDFVQSLSEEALQEDCYCQVLFAGAINRPVYEIIQHCLNHSTYHRGQVVTIGHQVGLKDAPMTDYMFYTLKVREKKQSQSKVPTSRQNSYLAVNFFSR